MAVSTSLQRLLAIRQAEEEHSRSEMDKAMAELRRLELAFTAAHDRGKRARLFLASSTQTGEIVDRIAGLHDIKTADRARQLLREKIDSGTIDLHHKRQQLVARRIARRQVETLVEVQSAEARAHADRKTQSALDDWHRSQSAPEKRKAGESLINSDISLTK